MMRFNAHELTTAADGTVQAPCGCRWRDLPEGRAHFMAMCAVHAAALRANGYVAARIEVSPAKEDKQ